MKSPDAQSGSVERIYSLTLLVNEAIENDSTLDLVSLLEQRGQAIESLAPGDICESDRKILTQVAELGVQMEAKLLGRKNESLSSLQGIATTKTGISSYRKQR